MWTFWASQVVLVVKNLPASVGGVKDMGSIPGLGGSPWRRAWQPTAVFFLTWFMAHSFSGGSVVKKKKICLPMQVGDAGSVLGSGKIPWSKKWQPTPVFLPGKFHGQRSLAGYSSWGCKESDTTEQLNKALKYYTIKRHLIRRKASKDWKPKLTVA